MHWQFVIAAAATAIAAIGHIVTGERDVLRPLHHAGVASASHVRLAWHLAAVAWVGLAAVLGLAVPAADTVSSPVIHTVAITLGASAAIVFVHGRGRNPAGYLFGLAAIVAWIPA